MNLYATASRGYKSGGFATFGFDLHGQDINDDGSAPAGHDAARVRPRASGQLRDRRQRRGSSTTTHAAERITLYRYDYTDLQARLLRPGLLAGGERRRGDGPGTRGGPALGAELSTGTRRSASRCSTPRSRTRPTSSPSARCEDCDGKSLPSAPEVSGSAIVSYKWPMASGHGFFTTEYIYRSKAYGGPDNFPDATADAWDEFSFRLGYRTGRLLVRDALGRERLRFRVLRARLGERGLQQPVRLRPLQRARWPSRPRTVGVTFGTAW